QLEGSVQVLLKSLPSDPFARPIRTCELRPLLFETKAVGHRLGHLEVASTGSKHTSPERKVPDIERPNPNCAGNKRTLPGMNSKDICRRFNIMQGVRIWYRVRVNDRADRLAFFKKVFTHNRFSLESADEIHYCSMYELEFEILMKYQETLQRDKKTK
ncbi:hypothetical protein P692DRAFT_20748324, partial [Suillus brevipes Sb2]